MPYKHYDWAKSLSPPILQQHSIIKHKIIEEYFEKYVLECFSKNSKITIIDGFSGGGIYRKPESKELCLGSPFIFLQTIDKIKKKIKSKYKIDFNIDIKYYFIDHDNNALFSLGKQLHKRGYGNSIGENIFLLHGKFSSIHCGLTEIIKHRRGRVLFLLDQYGYKDVPLHIIKNIFSKFCNVEILITFAVGTLINYLTNTPKFYKCLGGGKHKYSFLSQNDIAILSTIKKSAISTKEMSAWRAIAERKILKKICRILKNINCTHFSIKSQKSKRNYWLLHLSSQIKAQNMMAKIYRNYSVNN